MLYSSSLAHCVPEAKNQENISTILNQSLQGNFYEKACFGPGRGMLIPCFFSVLTQEASRLLVFMGNALRAAVWRTSRSPWFQQATLLLLQSEKTFLHFWILSE